MGRRTKNQIEFDLAAHGWAFCTKSALIKRIERCWNILRFDDKEREDTLQQMEKRAREMGEGD